jgi:hypothetical protein
LCVYVSLFISISRYHLWKLVPKPQAL